MPSVGRSTLAAVTPVGTTVAVHHGSLARAACVIGAPLTFAAAWWLLASAPEGGPTATWRIAHVLFLFGLALMLGAASFFYVLAREAGARFAGAALAMVIAGAIGLAGNFTLDLAAAQIAQSSADMDRFFSTMTGDPLIRALFYTALPYLFYAGLLVQVALVRGHRGIARWAPVPVAIGIVLLGVERGVGIPALAVIAHAALVPGFAAVARYA